MDRSHDIQLLEERFSDAISSLDYEEIKLVLHDIDNYVRRASSLRLFDVGEILVYPLARGLVSIVAASEYPQKGVDYVGIARLITRSGTARSFHREFWNVIYDLKERATEPEDALFYNKIILKYSL